MKTEVVTMWVALLDRLQADVKRYRTYKGNVSPYMISCRLKATISGPVNQMGIQHGENHDQQASKGRTVDEKGDLGGRLKRHDIAVAHTERLDPADY